MTEPQQELTPQEPGAIDSIDHGKLDTLAEGNVGDLVESLDALTDDELEALHAIELKGKGRTTALGAITREQQHRVADAGMPPAEPESTRAPLGDADSYARMRASEINPASLTRPVLTLDGWLLPKPAATPQA